MSTPAAGKDGAARLYVGIGAESPLPFLILASNEMSTPAWHATAQKSLPDSPLPGVSFTHVKSRSMSPEEFAAAHQPEGTPGKKAVEIAQAVREFALAHDVDNHTAYMALRMQQPELFAGS